MLLICGCRECLIINFYTGVFLFKSVQQLSEWLRISCYLPLFLPFISGCIQEKGRQEGKETVIIFKHGKIAGDPEPFRQLLDRFEKENPGIKVNDETLPASTDEQHQFYAINLEGRSSDFDVLSMDRSEE